MSIYALHGFLGRPSDWQESLPQAIAVDLFQAPIKSFEEWAKQFNDSVPEGSLLVGYSLGGRLALHALQENPIKWKGAVIISAHPGLPVADRPQRVIHDKKWAKRFLNDPWEKVMNDWNSQPVFSGHQIERREEEFDRAILSSVLEQWSLGKQTELDVSSLPMPLLWITGEKEHKKCPIFANPRSKVWIAPGAGHRVPWESGEFREQLQDFLEFDAIRF